MQEIALEILQYKLNVQLVITDSIMLRAPLLIQGALNLL
jgi:hypothetical protein